MGKVSTMLFLKIQLECFSCVLPLRSRMKSLLSRRNKQSLLLSLKVLNYHLLVTQKGCSSAFFHKMDQAVEGQQPAAVCFCSRDIRLKVREQVPHWYFLTSAWVCRCARRFERSAKARLQCGQENGRSPKKQNKKG